MRKLLLALILLANPVLLWSQSDSAMKFIQAMPTKDGFSADLFLTSNKDVFQEVVPDPQHLVALDSVKRGVPFYTVILFANAASKNGKPDMVYAITNQ